MKKAMLTMITLSSLLMSFHSFSQEADFDEMFNQNQFGKIEAAMILSLEDRADQLEKELLRKEATFDATDLTEGKLMAAMVNLVIGDLDNIRSKISNGIEGSEIDLLTLRMSELESIVSEF